DNLRVAFAWALERGDMTTTFGLITGLRWFWLVRGTNREIRSWFERALERFATSRGVQRAEALFHLSWYSVTEGDLVAAEQAFSQAVAEAHDFDLPRLESSRLLLLAQFAMMRGDLARAAELCDDTLTYLQRLGEPVPLYLRT